jgi:hypothetical protein
MDADLSAALRALARLRADWERGAQISPRALDLVFDVAGAAIDRQAGDLSSSDALRLVAARNLDRALAALAEVA